MIATQVISFPAVRNYRFPAVSSCSCLFRLLLGSAVVRNPQAPSILIFPLCPRDTTAGAFRFLESRDLTIIRSIEKPKREDVRARNGPGPQPPPPPPPPPHTHTLLKVEGVCPPHRFNKSLTPQDLGVHTHFLYLHPILMSSLRTNC